MPSPEQAWLSTARRGAQRIAGLTLKTV